jgi:hypothetical protein
MTSCNLPNITHYMYTKFFIINCKIVVLYLIDLIIHWQSASWMSSFIHHIRFQSIMFILNGKSHRNLFVLGMKMVLLFFSTLLWNMTTWFNVVIFVSCFQNFHVMDKINMENIIVFSCIFHGMVIHFSHRNHFIQVPYFFFKNVQKSC